MTIKHHVCLRHRKHPTSGYCGHTLSIPKLSVTRLSEVSLKGSVWILVLGEREGYRYCSQRVADRWNLGTPILLRETPLFSALKVLAHSKKVKSFTGKLD